MHCVVKYNFTTNQFNYTYTHPYLYPATTYTAVLRTEIGSEKLSTDGYPLTMHRPQRPNGPNIVHRRMAPRGALRRCTILKLSFHFF